LTVSENAVIATRHSNALLEPCNKCVVVAFLTGVDGAEDHVSPECVANYV